MGSNPFLKKGGRIGSYHGSAFNQYKRLAREKAIRTKFHYAMFKAFLEDMAAQYAEGQKEEDLAAAVHPVLVEKGLVPSTTRLLHVLRWIHDYVLFLKGETEFECPETLQHLLNDSSAPTPPAASEASTDPDKSD